MGRLLMLIHCPGTKGFARQAEEDGSLQQKHDEKGPAAADGIG